MAQSHINSPRVDAIHIVLIIAAVFAIGSVGFFLAILLGRAYGPASQEVSHQAQFTVTQKMNVVASLSSSSSTTIATSSSSSGQDVSGVPAQQADQGDSAAATKLQVLNSLNGQ